MSRITRLLATAFSRDDFAMENFPATNLISRILPLPIVPVRTVGRHFLARHKYLKTTRISDDSGTGEGPGNAAKRGRDRKSTLISIGRFVVFRLDYFPIMNEQAANHIREMRA